MHRRDANTVVDLHLLPLRCPRQQRRHRRHRRLEGALVPTTPRGSSRAQYTCASEHGRLHEQPSSTRLDATSTFIARLAGPTAHPRPGSQLRGLDAAKITAPLEPSNWPEEAADGTRSPLPRPTPPITSGAVSCISAPSSLAQPSQISKDFIWLGHGSPHVKSLERTEAGGEAALLLVLSQIRLVPS